MSRIKLLYAASRDVIGGGFGGLLAAWALSDMHQFAVTLSGITVVFALATLYWIFQRMIAHEEENQAKQDQEEELSRQRPRWPPHRAS